MFNLSINIELLLTSTMVLEVVTAIAQLETGVIAIARLIAQILDNRIHRRLLNHARRVASVATELSLTARAASRQRQQQRQPNNSANQPPFWLRGVAHGDKRIR